MRLVSYRFSGVLIWFLVWFLGVDHPGGKVGDESPDGFDMFGGHTELFYGFVERGAVAAEPFLAGGFGDDEWDVAGAHHGLPVALLVEVWAAEEEGEHGGAFVGGTHEVLLGLWEHVGDCGFGEAVVERMEEGDYLGLAHRFIDRRGDSVGLRGAGGGGVDGLVAFVGREGVVDIHGGTLDPGIVKLLGRLE